MSHNSIRAYIWWDIVVSNVEKEEQNQRNRVQISWTASVLEGAWRKITKAVKTKSCSMKIHVDTPLSTLPIQQVLIDFLLDAL